MNKLAIAFCSLITASCVPKNIPQGPGIEPLTEGATSAKKAVKSASAASFGATEVLLGQMCPEAVSGRPAVRPLVARKASWLDDNEDLGSLVERRQARQFSVLGWDGRRVGVFSVAGAGDNDGDAVAIGAYAGNSPCGSVPQAGAAASSDSSCVSVMGSCGLAVSVLEPASGNNARPYDEQGEPASLAVGTSCVADGKLIVDLDGDGKGEAFSTDDFVAAFTEPSQEIAAVAAGESKCNGTFATPDVVRGTDPKGFRGMDVLGVVDLDGDTHRELVLGFRYPDKTTWAVYSVRGSTLVLAGENEVWAPGFATAAAPAPAPAPAAADPAPAAAPAPKAPGAAIKAAR